MPLPLTVSCFSKIQIGLPFWYRLTLVVLDKGPLNGCVCCLDPNVVGPPMALCFQPVCACVRECPVEAFFDWLVIDF